MAKSWEFTEEEKKEIQEKQREIGLQFDPETGMRKVETENVDNTGDEEEAENIGKGREREIDDGNIR